MNIKQDNILNANEGIIVHQVNCLGVMGAGLAKQIKTKYPNVYNTYYNYTNSNPKSKLLGQNLMITPQGSIVDPNVKPDNSLIISNIYGQLNIGRHTKQTDEMALQSGLSSLAHFARKFDLSVAIPYKIGCGLGGGDWVKIKQIIDASFSEINVTIYKL